MQWNGRPVPWKGYLYFVSDPSSSPHYLVELFSKKEILSFLSSFFMSTRADQMDTVEKEEGTLCDSRYGKIVLLKWRVDE